MFRNYLKISLRNLIRQKSFSFINIFGLAAGLACSILIMLWIKHELSYDRHHIHSKTLYRITCGTEDIGAAITPAPLAHTMKTQFPEVEQATRLSRQSKHLFAVDDKRYEESRVFFADTNFFELFTYPMKSGDPSTALDQPQSIVLTEAMARKYFGRDDAMGKILRVDNKDDFVVTGVFTEIPGPSHLSFDFILPMPYLARTDRDLSENRWGDFDYYSYVMLADHHRSTGDLSQLEHKMDELFKNSGQSIQVTFHLQPLKRIHLYSNFLGDVPGHGNIQYVYIFSVIALFILIIACINFMNLSTARSTRRAREVGFRKVAGAQKGQLVVQFLFESCLFAFLALFVAIALVSSFLPAFNKLTGKDIGINILDGTIIGAILILTLIIGLISGSYPALYLSGFNPVKVFNLQRSSGVGHRWFRDGLVITQFVFSIILIAGTWVVHQQQKFIRNQNLGFNRENLLYMELRGELRSDFNALRSALERSPLTSQYSIVEDLPTYLTNATFDLKWEGKDPEEQILFAHLGIDDRFIDVFNMELASGRSFSKVHGNEENRYLLNREAVNIMGMEMDDVIGKPLTLWDQPGTIIGVVEDFHFKPIQQPIEPMVMRYLETGEYAVVRTRPGSLEATIHEMESINRELNPAYPFKYGFVDQDLDNLYQSEQRLSKLIHVFALLAIFISCLGLYGLSAYLAERRKKEIGVRKVVGATVFQLSYLLSRDFSRPIWIAMIIAVPIAYLASTKWLENFAYHIDLGWTVFLFSCLIAWIIALITVSMEATKAALTNPVEVLQKGG